MAVMDTPFSTITISSEEINLLIHSYLLDSGFIHSAYSLCQEGRLQKSKKFKKHIPRGELVELLSKSLLYKEVEAHYRGGDLVGQCRANFSLLETHICSVNPDFPEPIELSPSHFMSVSKPNASPVPTPALVPASTSTAMSTSSPHTIPPASTIQQKAFKRKASPTIIESPVEKRSRNEEPKVPSQPSTSMSVPPRKSTSSAPPDINDRIRKGAFRRALKGHTSEIFVSMWHPTDHRVLASGAKDSTLNIWTVPDDLNNRSTDVAPITLKFDNQEKSTIDVTSLHWNFDGSMLAVGSYDAALRVVSRDGEHQVLWMNHTGPIFTIRFSPNGRHIISASLDGTSCLFDFKERKLVRRYNNHHDCVLDTVWITNTQFASCGADGMIFVMDINQATPLKTFTGHVNEVNQIRPNKALTHLASCSDDKTARIWNLATVAVDDTIPGLSEFGPPMILSGHEHAVTSLVWCEPEGQPPLLATGSFDTTTRLWDSATGECLRILRDFKKPIYVLSAAPDGRWIAAAGADGCLRAYHTQEEKKQWYWTVENARPGIFDIDWRSWDDGKVQRMALSLECQQVMILDSKGIQNSFE